MKAHEAPHLMDTESGWFVVIPSIEFESGPYSEAEAGRILRAKCIAERIPIAETKYGQPIYDFVDLGNGVIVAPEVQYPACGEARYREDDEPQPPAKTFRPIPDPYA